MANLIKWDQTGERFYETGVDHGVVYPVSAQGTYPTGFGWNGLTAVNETPSGGEANDVYADNIKYLSLMSAEQLGLTIEAFYSPEEFDECDGSAVAAKGVTVGQQPRRGFGFTWRNKVGNDVNDDLGYKLKLAYGCKASPSEKDHNTVNDSPEATQLSWEINTTPVTISTINPATGKVYNPTSLLTIDSTKADLTKLAALEEILYGKEAVYAAFSGSSFEADTDYYELVDGTYTKTTDTDPESGKTYYTQTSAEVAARLPLPDEVFSILADG